MWKAMGGVKTIVGLSAFSLALAYLIAGKLIEKGLIQSSSTIALLFVFFFVFVITNLLIVVFHKKWQGKPSGSNLEQRVGIAKKVNQSVHIEKDLNENSNINQTVTIAEDVEQKID